MSHENKVQVLPVDEYNETLVSHVHPNDWVNPEPAERYNLVVIGGGTAGLVSAIGAAGLGAKVALVERHLMGGDCLNVGCVPSKCLIRSSRVVKEIKQAQEFGINVGDPDANFAAVMERMRKLRAGISGHDSAQRFKDAGIDVFLGDAAFTGRDRVEVAGKTLRFSKAVIASGARAFVPPIEGLKEAGFVTNETVFSLTERPKHLAVIGAGPIGVELAQAFGRFGSEVTLIQGSGQFLSKEDPDAAKIIADTLAKEGIRVRLNTKIKKVMGSGKNKQMLLETEGKEETLSMDEILVGAGRAPNVEGLGLEAAGVQYDKYGVKVDDYLQTANSNIFAAGDICMQYKFTHTADAAARIVIQNALFFKSKKLSALTVPWCTYSDPEVAHVGLYEKDAQKQGIEIDTYRREFKEVDRAIADGETEGFVKIHTEKGTDKILGATIVASHAGDMISEITTAMVGGVGLGTLSSVIHPYPTQAEAIKQAADQYNRTRLTSTVKNLFSTWLKWTR